jgi:dipeptidyl aminopeptidase/acylaminoacyl peptidase
MSIKHSTGAMVLIAGLLLAECAYADREPVLQQIDLPHPYYYREMYLPQLTSGPSSLAWSANSTEIIFSMAGSLWRQRLDSGPATQLTADQSYDYQPDWSPDGRFVIYCSYRNDALELWVLDLSTGATRALTDNGAVNVEPRFSPDGKKIAFTSTVFHKRFHVFTADFEDGKLDHIERLTGERKSEQPRYYYSEFDHEISPVWSRDGREIIYLSNRNHLYGTGGFWRIAVPGSGGHTAKNPEGASLADASAREFHYEETNWRSRPDFSPDGSRLVYSSYLGGRSWHNLWLMPARGGDPFPITYGDWDMTYPRWSPDGSQIAFISNKSGDTQIALIHVPGGLVKELAPPERRYMKPTATLQLALKDRQGRPAAARISVTDAQGRFYAPPRAWIHADDGFDRSQRHFEQHYFHAENWASLDVPAGLISVDIVHGMERKIEHRQVTMSANQITKMQIDCEDGTWSVPDPGHWVSADVHVHMNYGGTYRNTPGHLVSQARAENLGMLHSLIVNKEQRFPDIAYSGMQRDVASLPNAIVVHGQEYHTSYWGHLGLLDIAGGIILPGYAGYPNTAASSLYPMNADIADIAHARSALVGYVHPFDELPEPVAKPHESLTSELPLDVALGKVDYMEILGFSDHRSTAAIWYRLLNLGFRLPAAGGTDAMADFASLRGPVGMNRVYARVPDGEVKVEDWLEGLKRGRTFATNGPLLGLHLGGVGIGDELKLASAPASVPFSVHLRSIVSVDHLDLVCNGQVLRSFATQGPLDRVDVEGSVPMARGGWCLLRAATDLAREEVLDNYVYATTSPIYVSVGSAHPSSPEDAKFFAAWMDRLAEAAAKYPDWNSPDEKRGVLERIARAKVVFSSAPRP